MSGYPFGYPYQGQPPPPQQYPSYQPYGTYPPPNGFGTTPPQPQQQQQPYAPPTTSYYANAQSAYDYNASSIPGLGTPSSGPPPFPVPYNGAWNPSGYGASAPQVPFHAHAPATSPSSAPTTYPSSQAQVPPPQVPPPMTPIHVIQPSAHSNTVPRAQQKTQPTAEQPQTRDSHVEVQEEGEIDDGYFDDLYDDASKAASVINETAPPADRSTGDMVDDSLDQEPNFYDTDMEDVSASQKPSAPKSGEKTQESGKVQGQPDRDRSRSYSPHLSPAENGSTIQDDIGVGTQLQPDSATPAIASSNRIHGNGSHAKNGAAVEASVAAATSPIPRTTYLTSFGSVFEASNEAKKAILRLLPHGVKYQTYIDEGFDAKVIKDLFMQLNLPTDSATSGPPKKPATTQDKGIPPPSTTQPMPQTQIDTVDKKQEARKDKIARLMAEKKAKLAAASTSTGAATELSGGANFANAVSTPPAKPPITRAEKDRLLQQKVEALRNKAREAKKLTQKSAPPQTFKPDAAQQTAPQQVPTATTQPPVPQQSTSGTPLSSASQSAAASPGVSADLSMPRAPQINQRKRPVAADFMDYPPLPVKRPSLANRENSSLVISISDDEDDDDVEMEVDSATEDSPASLPQTLTLTRRGPSIRDFPPLSNIKAARQIHSPVNGSSTPGAKNANVDLETKERAILEMQRRIKELEAKKEAKARSGNVTPRSPSAGGIVLPEHAVQTPVRRVVSSIDADDKTTPSAQLLQEAEAASGPVPTLVVHDTQTEDERRVRVPSAQLSGKSAKALAKAERLRRMQEEMQRLQAEIDEEEDDDDDVEVEESDRTGEVKGPAQTHGTQASQATLVSVVNEPDAEVNSAQSLSPSPLEEGQTASEQTSPDTQAMQIDSSPDPSGYSMKTAAPSHAAILMDQIATPPPVVPEAGKLPDASAATNPSQPREPLIANRGEINDHEPAQPKIDGRVGVDSPKFSPAPAEIPLSATQRRGEVTETAREVFVGSSHPIGTSLTYSKAVNDIAPTRQATFAPYESPLRYYHAYRFHNNYNDGVQGGLKSLTYSNRIDPNKEMCPDEWEGNDCPRGDACQFQHFQSIIAPDSEIILELGNSDEFTGEQKREFNNGLREVVASFQKSKVRDFRTIAQAIVDFRHRFLGDSSKVLRLEGVNI